MNIKSGNFDRIKPGYTVHTTAGVGFSTGGPEKVLKVTNRYIDTGGSKYSRRTGNALNGSAFYIDWWTSDRRRK